MNINDRICLTYMYVCMYVPTRTVPTSAVLRHANIMQQTVQMSTEGVSVNGLLF